MKFNKFVWQHIIYENIDIESLDIFHYHCEISKIKPFFNYFYDKNEDGEEVMFFSQIDYADYVQFLETDGLNFLLNWDISDEQFLTISYLFNSIIQKNIDEFIQLLNKEETAYCLSTMNKRLSFFDFLKKIEPYLSSEQFLEQFFVVLNQKINNPYEVYDLEKNCDFIFNICIKFNLSLDNLQLLERHHTLYKNLEKLFESKNKNLFFKNETYISCVNYDQNVFKYFLVKNNANLNNFSTFEKNLTHLFQVLSNSQVLYESDLNEHKNKYLIITDNKEQYLKNEQLQSTLNELFENHFLTLTKILNKDVKYESELIQNMKSELSQFINAINLHNKIKTNLSENKTENKKHLIKI